MTLTCVMIARCISCNNNANATTWMLLLLLHLLSGAHSTAEIQPQPFTRNLRREPPKLSPTKFKENISLISSDLQDLLPIRPHRLRMLDRRRNARLTQPLMQLPSRKRQMYLTCFAIVFVWYVNSDEDITLLCHTIF